MPLRPTVLAGQRRTKAQATPYQAAAATHLKHYARYQRLVRAARGLALASCRGQHLDPGVRNAQRLSALVAPLALQQARGQQVQLDQVMAGPASRPPHLAQAAAVNRRQLGRGHGATR